MSVTIAMADRMASISKDRRIEWPQTKEEKVGSQFQLVTAATKINVGMPCLVLELLPMKCSYVIMTLKP